MKEPVKENRNKKVAFQFTLHPDAIKVIYRGNFTKKQAGYYLGVGEDEIQKLIDNGSLAINLQKGEEKVSRLACDNYLKSKEYIKRAI